MRECAGEHQERAGGRREGMQMLAGEKRLYLKKEERKKKPACVMFSV